MRAHRSNGCKRASMAVMNPHKPPQSLFNDFTVALISTQVHDKETKKADSADTTSMRLLFRSSSHLTIANLRITQYTQYRSHSEFSCSSTIAVSSLFNQYIRTNLTSSLYIHPLSLQPSYDYLYSSAANLLRR